MLLPDINEKEVKSRILNYIKLIKEKSGVNGVVIGLSGGLDSTIVTYLLQEVIDVKNIFGFHFYDSITSKEDTKHARLVAELFNIRYEELDISILFEDFIKVFNGNKSTVNNNGEVQKLSMGNLKSRIRMSFLYYYANLNNCIVAGTCNKSELLIGYFTKYGDGASDFLPISDIYKTQLKKLAIEWNIPEEIVNKPPIAGLWPGQSDEKELSISYDILDKLLYLIVDKKLDNDTILKEISISPLEIDRIRNKINNNKHKRCFPSSPFEGE